MPFRIHHLAMDGVQLFRWIVCFPVQWELQ